MSVTEPRGGSWTMPHALACRHADEVGYGSPVSLTGGRPCLSPLSNSSNPRPWPSSKPTLPARRPRRSSCGARAPTRSPCSRKRNATRNRSTSIWRAPGEARSSTPASDTSPAPRPTVDARCRPRTSAPTTRWSPSSTSRIRVASPSVSGWSLPPFSRTVRTPLAICTCARCTAATSSVVSCSASPVPAATWPVCPPRPSATATNG